VVQGVGQVEGEVGEQWSGHRRPPCPGLVVPAEDGGQQAGLLVAGADRRGRLDDLVAEDTSMCLNGRSAG